MVTSASPSAMEFPSEPQSVAVARRWVAERLAAAPRAARDDVVLAASELVTNAVQHGGGGPVEVSVVATETSVAVAVTGRAGDAVIPAVETWGAAPPSARAGRGLGIVRAVSDRVSVERVGDHVSVRFERSLALPDGS